MDRQKLAAFRGRKRRGQSLVEFAMVIPTMLLILFGFIQLSIWTFDGAIINHAARAGTRAANAAMFPINSAFANIPILGSPYYVNQEIFWSRALARFSSSAGACLRQRNTPSLNRDGVNIRANRLGWDWGCLRVVNVQTPLQNALIATNRVLNEMFLGPRIRTSVRACYLIVDNSNGNGDVLPALCLTSTDGGSPVLSVTPNNLTTPAPSFIRVEVDVTLAELANIPLLPFSPSLSLRSSSIEVLDRFLSACPAPDRPAEVVPGSCGVIY